ncbi:MAG TPA: hypothetical protein DCY48_00790 [Candidatus Magasanikbacteria bacterium]|nr:hypothetical protein [Candidatus Magasanikbacteria bacterium]
MLCGLFSQALQFFSSNAAYRRALRFGSFVIKEVLLVHMHEQYVWHNKGLIPKEEARVPIGNIAAMYGFGVYENVRFRNGRVFFLDRHIDRLFRSAALIGLEHFFLASAVREGAQALVLKNYVTDANMKMVLLGGKTAEDAQLFLMALAPKFVEKSVYRKGVRVLARHYERFLPQAKTLNMLPSYLFFREAEKAGAYDTILVNREGNITEGTRSNIFVIRGEHIITPAREHVLLGVTRETVIECLREHGYTVKEQSVPLDRIGEYEGAFLTNTSGKVVPTRKIDEHEFSSIPELVRSAMAWYDAWLETKGESLI